jgi:hypothetical protein
MSEGPTAIFLGLLKSCPANKNFALTSLGSGRATPLGGAPSLGPRVEIWGKSSVQASPGELISLFLEMAG